MSEAMPVTIQKTYRYRMKPTPQQEALFRQFAGARRWVWNWALAKRKAYYRATGKHLSSAELYAELTRLKREPGYAWLRLMSAQSLQQAIRDQDRAYAIFFKHLAERKAGKRGRRVVGPPRFKSRKRSPLTFRLPQSLSLRRGRLVIIGRFFPSSRLCPDCGAINQDLTLSDRVWRCGCGAVHDRDLNAACNIRAEGLRLLLADGTSDSLNASGVSVRLAAGEHDTLNEEAPAQAPG